MKLQKRGQGISINIIIIAAIALLVLVVLVAIFSGRMGLFGRELDLTTRGTCVAQGGQVVARDVCPDNCRTVYGSFNDVGAGSICCKPAEVCIGASTCSGYLSEATCRTAGCSWGLSTRSC